VPTPFEDFNKVARGLVKGGITILKAPPGSGKSSLLRALQHDQVTQRGCKVAVLMMEEVKSITGRAMASYQLGKNVMTKEDAKWNGVSEEDVKKALEAVVTEDEKFISFDVNPQDPIADTLKQCKQAVAFYNVDYIYIDHLQRLAYLSGTDGATSALTELAVQLTEFAKRKDIGIICISHVNQDGSVKYAKSVEEEAIVVIELERDKQADDFEERNTAYLTVTKNRPFGTTGSSGALTYDVDTTILKERKGPQEPKPQVNEEF
jgi:predicted ATP-dependent serine protease